MAFFKTVLIAIQMLSALALIGLVMSQTTKSEGLTGTIGGKASSSFRGKPGIDDKLADLTKWCAIAFMVSSALVYYLAGKVA
ncbi:MAG TPA: preprotein translocase subunit SecG [Armatimonadota bacterium]|nr:preprotein translocase subunit SecG [Armatimonadota bacterium]